MFGGVTGRNANGVAELDGVWTVERAGGLLPPMPGVRKEISGRFGATRVGPLRMRFEVVGDELRYCGLLRGLVDRLEPDDDGYDGCAFFRGLELGRFRMQRPAAS